MLSARHGLGRGSGNNTTSNNWQEHTRCPFQGHRHPTLLRRCWGAGRAHLAPAGIPRTPGSMCVLWGGCVPSQLGWGAQPIVYHPPTPCRGTRRGCAERLLPGGQPPWEMSPLHVAVLPIFAAQGVGAQGWEMRWDGMGRDGVRWDGVRWDGV